MAASEIANDWESSLVIPSRFRPAGSGHTHVSIGDGRRNLFEDPADRRRAQAVPAGYHFMAA